MNPTPLCQLHWPDQRPRSGRTPKIRFNSDKLDAPAASTSSSMTYTNVMLREREKLVILDAARVLFMTDYPEEYAEHEMKFPPPQHRDQSIRAVMLAADPPRNNFARFQEMRNRGGRIGRIIKTGNFEDKIVLGRGDPWEAVHREMMGGAVERIGEKILQPTDKDTGQSRLLFPKNLKKEVYKRVSKDEKNKKIKSAGLKVTVLDYHGRRYEMICKYRKSHKGMVFNRGWKLFLDRHRTELRFTHDAADYLRIFAFRSGIGGQLCFVFLIHHQN